MNPRSLCNCNSMSSVCGICSECNMPACYDCSITYLEFIVTHHDCMTKKLKSQGVHFLNIAHLFNAIIYSREYTESQYDKDWRPVCKRCHISDVPIRFMIRYKSNGFIHPGCVSKSDEQYNEWISLWYKNH